MVWLFSEIICYWQLFDFDVLHKFMVERGLFKFPHVYKQLELILGEKYWQDERSSESFLCFWWSLFEVEEDCLEPIWKILGFV